MGAGGAKGPMREIDDTKQSLRDDKFQLIVERIKKIATEFSDDTSPMYTEIGTDEFQLGSERIVKFNMNRFDYELIRQVHTHRLSGEGRQKHLEENHPPKTIFKLYKKGELEQDWVAIDLDEMF